MYTYYTLQFVNKNGDWLYNSYFIGDSCNIKFSIVDDGNGNGQVKYTSPNYSEFKSLIFKYRVVTN